MLAFVHIQKTAGTTLTAILRRSFGLRHFDTRCVCNTGNFTAAQLRRVAMVYPKLASIAGHSVRPFGDLDAYCPEIRYYTFLREPLSRTKSHFRFAVRRRSFSFSMQGDFRAAVREYLARHRNFQTVHLAGCEDAEAAIEVLRRRVTFVGLVERFDESLVMFRRWAPEPPMDISYVSQNVSNRSRDPREDALQQLVATDPIVAAELVESNDEDLKLYRWACDEAFPAQQAEFGPSLEEKLAEFRGWNRQSKRLWLSDSVAGRLYRNLVFKPLQRIWRIDRAA